MKRDRLGLRREVAILVPVSLVLLLALSGYSLLSYRSSLALLAEERRSEAARAARAVAGRLAQSGAPTEEELRRLARDALGAALLDERGEALLAVGDVPRLGLLAPLAGRLPAGSGVREGMGVGLEGATAERAIGFAPLPAEPAGRVVRVDLAAGTLARQMRALSTLQVVVLALDGAVLLLLVLFLRSLLNPFERLLAQARKVGEASRDEEDEGSFLVRLFTDLTEVRLKDREARLAEGLAQLGEMAAGVAHELRNSLATVSGYLSLAARRPDEATLDDYLGEIRRETEHLKRVVEDFLAFARPGTARLEPVDLAALVSRAAANPALAGARIEIAAGEPLPPLSGDAQLLERAVRNLLVNAVEAERGAGREPAGAEIALSRAAEGLELVIEDRGPGLPAAMRGRLFQPFASGRPGGVGLGLALSHRIVTLHGGKLTLGDRPGGGTRVRVTFPEAGDSVKKSSGQRP